MEMTDLSDITKYFATQIEKKKERKEKKERRTQRKLTEEKYHYGKNFTIKCHFVVLGRKHPHFPDCFDGINSLKRLQPY